MTSVFDNPFYPDVEGFMRHEEWERTSYELRDMLLEIEKLPPDQRADKLEEILQSERYTELSAKIQKLSEEFPQVETDPPIKDKPHVKPLQLITFVISGIWLGIGIRQWYVFSKWDSKYKKFRERQEELERKIDEEFDTGKDESDEKPS